MILDFARRMITDAVGKNAGYQAMSGILVLLTLPLAWFFLTLGFNAVSVVWAVILTSILFSIGRIFWAKYLVGLSPLKWAKEVFMPCLVTFLIVFFIGKCVQHCMEEDSLYRLGMVFICTCASSVLLGWLFILNKSEKQFFKLNFKRRFC